MRSPCASVAPSCLPGSPCWPQQGRPRAGGLPRRLPRCACGPASSPWRADGPGWPVRRSGLTATVVLADAAAISALALAQQHLVPAVLITDNTSWMLPLACTSVYILQITLRPWLGLPGAAMVVVAYGLGAGHPVDAFLLVVETIVAAGLVAVIRGGARQADAIVAVSLETERQVRAEEARRA